MAKKLRFLDRVYLTVLGLVVLFFLMMIADSATGGAILNTEIVYSCSVTSNDDQMMKGICTFNNKGLSTTEKCVDVELCKDPLCQDISAIKNICSGTLSAKERKDVQWWFTFEDGKYLEGYYISYA